MRAPELLPLLLSPMHPSSVCAQGGFPGSGPSLDGEMDSSRGLSTLLSPVFTWRGERLLW